MNTNDGYKCRNLAKTCPLCKKDFGEGNPSNICKLLKKGADKVNEASHKRGRDDAVAEGLRVHRDCRKWYANERDIQTSLKQQIFSFVNYYVIYKVAPKVSHLQITKNVLSRIRDC